MFVRTTKFNGITPDQITGKIDEVADKLLPELEREFGLIDGYVLVNHISGQVMGVTAYDSEIAMRNAERVEREMRDRVAVDWRVEPVIETWEVALTHNDLIERGRAALLEETNSVPA